MNTPCSVNKLIHWFVTVNSSLVMSMINPWTNDMQEGVRQMVTDGCSCAPYDSDDDDVFIDTDNRCCSSLTRSAQFESMKLYCFIVFIFCCLIIVTSLPIAIYSKYYERYFANFVAFYIIIAIGLLVSLIVVIAHFVSRCEYCECCKCTEWSALGDETAPDTASAFDVASSESDIV